RPRAGGRGAARTPRPASRVASRRRRSVGSSWWEHGSRGSSVTSSQIGARRSHSATSVRAQCDNEPTTGDRHPMPMTTTPRILLTGVILELTLATAYIHLTLGGTLFLLNAAGYVALGAAYLAVSAVPMPAIRRLSWLPRVGLAAFASV